MSDIIIQTPRLILRELSLEDAPALQLQANDPLMPNFSSQIPHPYTLQDAEGWLQHIDRVKSEGYKQELPLAITVNGLFAGVIMFLHIKQNHMALIGYWIGKEFRRKSYASEAVEHFCEYGFQSLHFQRIYTYVATTNIASSKILEKNDFLLEGTLRKNLFIKGEYKDHLLFARVK